MLLNHTWLHPNQCKHQLRRTSSLQLPNEMSTCGMATGGSSMIPSSSNLKLSNNSMYTSTLTATGILSSWRQNSGSATNLYTLMAKYRCCCGICRLQTGSLSIAISSSICSMLVIGIIFANPSIQLLPEAQQRTLCVPLLCVMAYQFFASILMIVALFSDIHYLVLPFQASCVLNIMFSMGFGILLLMSVGRGKARLYPLFAIVSTACVVLYVWFLVVSSLTFILIRDKRHFANPANSEQGHANGGGAPMNRNGHAALERTSSALF